MYLGKFLANWVGVFFALCLIAPGSAMAEPEADAKDKISLELNKLDQKGAACRMIMILKNNSPTAIEKFNIEVVLFDKDGAVSKFLAVELGAMTSGKTKVRQFDLAKTKCPDVSRILINDVSVCEGKELSPVKCMQKMSLSARKGLPPLGM